MARHSGPLQIRIESKIMSLNLTKRLTLIVTLVLLSGCSALPSVDDVLPDKKVEYKKSKQAEKNLEIPPDLTKSSINDKLVVPDAPAGDPTTLSGFMQKEKVQTRSASRTAVLPTIDRIQVMRDGDQRWLSIQADPEDVWFKTVAFWQENGILLLEQDPTVGIIVTDWLENRANIKSDIITDTIRKAFDGAYSAATRDQYRVRIEPGLKPGTTELYLTHRGMVEKVIQSPGGDIERTVWNPSGSDHGLEAEMLRRLMVYMGVADQQASRSLARRGQSDRPRSTLNRSSSQVSLTLAEDFSRAWRLTGVALDRVGFAVEDRDRSRGIYYVRYNDPMKETEDPGFLAKLAFWRDNDSNIDKESQYQVALSSEGGRTRIQVRNEQGVADNSETALRILTLLHEQLR